MATRSSKSSKRSGGDRSLKIADQIQRDLAELIARELKDPRVGLVTIQSVEVTPDYAHAKVYYTTLPSDAAALAATEAGLKDAAGYLHNLLFKRLHIHTVPTLHFLYDESVERSMEMSRLIELANASRAKE